MKALILDNKVVDVVETEFEVHPSMTWMDCPDDCKASEWELVDGVLQIIPEPEDTRTYVEFRQEQYAPTGDQLDMLWHAIDAGEFGDTAKQSEFYTANKAVKDANPKP
jgi:hypothetical protein